MMTTWIGLLLLGVLVNQSVGTSVTGRMVWICTYEVAGQRVQVTLERMCPVSMDFR